MAWIVAVAAFGILLVLAIYNPSWVTIKFLTWQTSMPLVALVLGAVALGGLVVGAYATVRGFGHFRRHREAAGRIRQLEGELARAQEQSRHLEQEVQRLRSQVQQVSAQAPALPKEGHRAGAPDAITDQTQLEKSE